MAKKITYLLGAGASANTIPVVAYMHERIQEISRFLGRIILKYSTDKVPSEEGRYLEGIYSYLDNLRDINYDLQWLISQAGDYYTIDTLAKKFYLIGDNKNLTKLKVCLITYLTLEQTLNVESKAKENYEFTKEPYDKRYSSLLASITKKIYPVAGNSTGINTSSTLLGFRIANDVKILSWNYDMQFELAIKSMLTKDLLSSLKSDFQILPSDNSRNEVNDVPINTSVFGMVKLNGEACWNKDITAEYAQKKITIFDVKPQHDNNENLLLDFLTHYKKGIKEQILDDLNSHAFLFNFAWEYDPNFRFKYPGHKKNLESADRIAANTEILVVIGYSFPVFNREIDNRLFQKMVKLEKIYIQDRNPERIESTMKNAFEILQKKKVVNSFGTEVVGVMPYPNELKQVDKITFQLEPYTDQFLIPYELNQ